MLNASSTQTLSQSDLLTSMGNTHIAYRADIDGMRAFAVLSVVIYHFFPKLIPGGFIGVDIFFVISGYLISGIIFKNLEKGSFSFVDFYARRIRRIFPPLILVLVAVSCLGWFSMLPSEFLLLQNMVDSTALFITNFTLLFEVGYFDGAAELKPLLHLWSLSVEEQFYIFYPIIILLIYRLNKTFLIPLLLLGSIVSFAVSIFFFSYKPEAVFYLLPSRAWELLIGSLIASGQRLSFFSSIWDRFKSTYSKWIFENGIAVIGISLITFGLIYATESSFPKWFALFPVLGSAALILGQGSFINHHFLSNSISVFIGKISYSLYLWHWPLFSIARLYYPDTLSISLSITLISLSFVLAILTTYFVEFPLRKRGLRTAGLLISAMMLVWVSSKLLSSQLPLAPHLRKQPDLVKIDHSIADWLFPSRYIERLKNRKQFPAIGRGSEHVLFIGDSNAEQYWPRILKLSEDDGFNNQYKVHFATMGGQLPTITDPQLAHYSPAEKIKTFLKNGDVSVVVLAAHWLAYNLSSEQSQGAIYLENTFEYLSTLAPKIYIILNIPVQEEQNPMTMFTRYLWKDWGIQYQSDYDAAPWLQRSQSINNLIKKLAVKHGIMIIDPAQALCSEGRCSNVEADGYPIYKDSTHLSDHYVREKAIFIDRIFSK
jgi:peptidoglycan/LPS O-acetylase OafA/YrhL